MNGQPGGMTGTGEIEIKILDINDNIPTLEKESVGVTQSPQPKLRFFLFILACTVMLCTFSEATIGVCLTCSMKGAWRRTPSMWK